MTPVLHCSTLSVDPTGAAARPPMANVVSTSKLGFRLRCDCKVTKLLHRWICNLLEKLLHLMVFEA